MERKVSLPVVYGGKLSKEEMSNLDRTVGKPADSEDVDIHFNQYVPDQNLVGRSAQLEDVEYEDEDDEEILKSSSSGKSGGGMFQRFFENDLECNGEVFNQGIESKQTTVHSLKL